MTSTPQRITRSMSSQPPSLAPVADTAPGPPIPARDTSTVLNAAHISNPYNVDLVIPFSISIGKSSDRTSEQREIREGYEELLRALEGVGGLRIATRVPPGKKGKEEVWVFVGAGQEKIEELVEVEK